MKEFEAGRKKLAVDTCKLEGDRKKLEEDKKRFGVDKKKLEADQKKLDKDIIDFNSRMAQTTEWLQAIWNSPFHVKHQGIQYLNN